MDQALLSVLSLIIVMHSGRMLGPADASLLILATNVIFILCAAVQSAFHEAALIDEGRDSTAVARTILFLVLPATSAIAITVTLFVAEGNLLVAGCVAVFSSSLLWLDVARWRGYRSHSQQATAAYVLVVVTVGLLLFFGRPTSIEVTFLMIALPCGLAALGIGGLRRPWIRGHGFGRPSGIFLTDYLISQGAVSIFPVASVALTGTAASAVLRSAQTLLGPANLMLSVTRVPVLRGGSALRASIWSVGAAALVLVVLIVAPVNAYVFVLGQFGSAAKPVAVVLGVQLVILGSYYSSQYKLRRAGLGRIILGIRVAGVFVTFGSAYFLVSAYGSLGLPMALLAGSLVNCGGTLVILFLTGRNERWNNEES